MKTKPFLPPWGPNDIGDERLSAGLDTHQRRELLNSVVDVSRSAFGWFTRHEPRMIEYPWLLDRLGNPIGLDILEVGAGISPVSLILAERGARVTTVDSHPVIYTAENVQNGNEWGFIDYSQWHDRVKSFHADAGSLALPGERFDVIYSLSVLEHIPAPTRRALWDKAAFWLKAGGRFFLSFDLYKGSLDLWNRSENKVVEPRDQHGDVTDIIRELTRRNLLLRTIHIEPLPDSLPIDAVFAEFIKP